MLLSAGIFMLAIVGAFATNASKNEAGKLASVPGYIKQGVNCVFKNNCQNINTGVLCTETQTGGATIFGLMDATHCAEPLWRLPN